MSALVLAHWPHFMNAGPDLLSAFTSRLQNTLSLKKEERNAGSAVTKTGVNMKERWKNRKSSWKNVGVAT